METKKQVRVKVTEVVKQELKGSSPKPASNHVSRDISRGVWELARFHTREAWLCWYPAGSLCFAIQKGYFDSADYAQSGEHASRRELGILRWTHTPFVEYSSVSGVA